MRNDGTARPCETRANARTRALLAGLGIGLLPTIGWSAQDDLRRIQAEAGKVWYDRYCTPCHGADGAPGTAMRSDTQKPVDLRTYVSRHGGKFPVHDWVAVVASAPPGSLHTQVWQKIRESQQETAATSAASRGVIVSIGTYVASVQTK